jgi:hypothetical protein
MTTDTTAETPLAVFEHQKRREWGLGIIAWQDKQKRGYLFENGQLRILAEEFYPLMREVDRPQDEVQALFDALKPELDAARREAGIHVRTPRHAPAVLSFDDQLAAFRSEYPEGFQDPLWIENQRGTGAKKRLTRHRDHVIAKAAVELSAAELKSLVAAEQLKSVSERAFALIRQTDLVTAAELAGLNGDGAERHGSLAAALVDLLHGESGFVARFDRFIAAFQRAFGRAPGWQLATVLSALVHPAEHICVRPASFREQAKWMAPRLALAKVPSGASYMRCLTMAKLVATKLGEQAESPRDLMDVYDFMRVTTRPAAKQLVNALKAAEQKQLAMRTESVAK